MWKSTLVTVALCGLASGPDGLQAQEPADRFVRIDTLNVRDTLYHLAEGGGNALALIDETNGGVVLVDSKEPGWGAAIREAIEQVTDLPITTVISTHVHADHAGSNGELGEAVDIIAHANTRAAVERAGGTAMPTTTFTERHTLLDGLDRIELYHFGAAHTDGDIVVVFPEKGVAYLGDLFPRKAMPVIDRGNGGSGLEFPETLARVVAGIDGVTRVITGHGPFPTTYAGRGRRERGVDRAWTGWMTWDDLAEYADFTRDVVQTVRAAFDEGRSVDEAAASLTTLARRYADYDLEPARSAVAAIYDELRSEP